MNQHDQRLIREYKRQRFHSALSAHRQTLIHGDPKQVASTRAELDNAATSRSDRSLARLALA